MHARGYQFAFLLIGVLVLSGLSFGQTGIIQGKVLDEKGQPVKDALVKIERQDIRGNYKVKTNKKGQYFHAGLPLGTYKVSLTINERVVDIINGVRTKLDPTEINFDLAAVARRQQAAQGGQPSEEQLRGMSAEERKKYEDALKQRREQISKNKKLNDTFNAGMDAFRARNYQLAVDSLKEAAEIDPEQAVVWANLAESESRLALTKTGDQRAQITEEAIASYRKAIELMPDKSEYYNNLGLALVRAGRIEEGQAELTKAAQMDPANGGKYYYNLGAIMVNTGNTQGAIDAFRQATELDPNYAAAYYQLGTALVGAAEIQEDGSVKPAAGTVEAFQRYLELDPNGPYAAGAQSMIQSLKGSVQTKYESPDKKKKRKK